MKRSELPVKDWYEEEYYATSPSLNPKGPNSGEFKVLRGGSWINSVSNLRSGTRAAVNPNDKINNIGFRCVVALGQ